MIKKLFILMVCMIFLAGTISAFEFDNKVTYSERDLKVDFDNLFGFGKHYGSVKLKSHTNVNDVVSVPQGQDIPVMFYDFNFTEEYVEGLGEVIFTDQKTGLIEKKDYYFAKAIYEDQMSGRLTNCKDKDTWANFSMDSCEYKETGLYKNFRGWEKLESNDIPAGDVRIALMTNVNFGDTYDAVWTLAGKKVNRHAKWTESSLLSGIFASYSLNSTSGTTVIDNLHTRDGILYNMENDDWSTNCINGRCLNFDGTNEYGNTTITTGLKSSDEFTISFWLNTTSTGDFMAFGSVNSGALPVLKIRLEFASEDGRFAIDVRDNGGGVVGKFVNASVNDGQWHIITIGIKQSTNLIEGYIDGINQTVIYSTQTTSNNDNIVAPLGICTEIDAQSVGSTCFDSTALDEINFWTRLLNQTERLDMYTTQGGYTDLFIPADSEPVINLNNPANLTTFTLTNIVEFSGTASDNSKVQNVSLVFEGSVNQTNSTPINNSQTNFTLTLSEGTYDWFYRVSDNATVPQTVDSTGRRFTINTEPSINIKNPIANTTNFSTSTVFFNATNSTPIDTWIINYNGTNITLSDINTSRTVEDGTYQLLLYANNSVSGKFGLNDSIYFTVDTTAPAVNITNPLNETIVTNFTKSLDLVILFNYTATDLHLDSCTLFNISSGLNFTSPTCLNQSFRTVFDTYTFIAEANDTLGFITTDYETATYDYNLLQNNFTFTNITLEGVSNTFTYDLNVSNGITVTAIDLIYNNTSYPTSLTTSGDNIISTVDVTAPLITTQTNISFHWNITQSDGFIFNTTNYTQTVNLLQIDNCSSYTTHIYNFTIIDEELQTNLANTTTDINLDIYTLDRSTRILNFSRSYPENPVQVCLSGNILAGNKFSLDSIIKYQAVNYAIEYYNIVNFTLSNSSIPQLINLFDLATADSTEFQITFKDSNFIVVEGALVHILRQYIAENNTFKTVELPKTDSNGQTVAHFVEKDVVYNILVTNGTTGEVLGSFNNIIAFCQDATIGDCVINLNALTSGKSVYDYNTDLKIGVSNLIYNGTTRDLSVDFFTFDGTSKTINLTAFQYDQLGNSTACSNTLTSSSGSISCNIPNSFGNASMSIFLYVDGDLIFTDFVAIDTERDFGDAGYLILFLMILAMVVMFSESKTGMIVAVMVGMISGILFSLATGKIIGIGSAIIWLIIAGSVLIWKLNKDKN